MFNVKNNYYVGFFCFHTHIFWSEASYKVKKDCIITFYFHLQLIIQIGKLKIINYYYLYKATENENKKNFLFNFLHTPTKKKIFTLGKASTGKKMEEERGGEGKGQLLLGLNKKFLLNYRIFFFF